ncbi:CheR family methyltransferase [Microbulbifer pacificus]|uniref:CheR family methyltransferase n=1 Tax=Microbulbifer pacificus TaxID=407164 RepID=A0AAU0MU77_9GAMM|nr:CheR family methyltransferase [Microbulbifer pacificus]WOX04144.1 CheR family methyltransferase [Microbulbifer pacificus]
MTGRPVDPDQKIPLHSTRKQQCAEFLQWALPELRLRWRGYHGVRPQVCKRLYRRITQLGIEDLPAYRRYLDTHPDEWQTLDAMSRVSISRFYRDRAVFDYLAATVLPELAQRARARGADNLNVWCAGAGAGEEPYTLAIIWELQLRAAFPELQINIVASDADANLCRRGKKAHYPQRVFKDMPAEWLDTALSAGDGYYCLKPNIRRCVEFRVEDLRTGVPTGPFDLVLCRNLAFTYFNTALQHTTLERLQAAMNPGAALVLGIHEHLPEGSSAFHPWAENLRIYRL